MKNFSGLNAEIKKQKSIYARFDNERGRRLANWKAAVFRLALLNYWKKQGIGLPSNYKQLWNPPAEWTVNTLKERTPLHRWQADAIYNELVASAVKKVKNAKSPMGRWIASDELAKKVAELNSRPIL